MKVCEHVEFISGEVAPITFRGILSFNKQLKGFVMTEAMGSKELNCKVQVKSLTKVWDLRILYTFKYANFELNFVGKIDCKNSEKD